jgi:hypothetical protein
MHKTEGTNHVSNTFKDTPNGTIVEQDWLNAVQNELVSAIEDSETELTLKTAATETGDQLLAAIRKLSKDIGPAAGPGRLRIKRDGNDTYISHNASLSAGTWTADDSSFRSYALFFDAANDETRMLSEASGVGTWTVWTSTVILTKPSIGFKLQDGIETGRNDSSILRIDEESNVAYITVNARYSTSPIGWSSINNSKPSYALILAANEDSRDDVRLVREAPTASVWSSWAEGNILLDELGDAKFNGDVTIVAPNKLKLGTDTSLYRSAVKYITVDDNASGRLSKVDVNTNILNLPGATTSKVTFNDDVAISRTGTTTLNIDDNAAGSLTGVNIETDKLQLVGADKKLTFNDTIAITQNGTSLEIDDNAGGNISQLRVRATSLQMFTTAAGYIHTVTTRRKQISVYSIALDTDGTNLNTLALERVIGTMSVRPQAASGSNHFGTISLDFLPDGATITKVQLEGSTDAADGTVSTTLYKFPLGGPTATTISTGSMTGGATSITLTPSEVVDFLTNTYQLEIRCAAGTDVDNALFNNGYVEYTTINLGQL